MKKEIKFFLYITLLIIITFAKTPPIISFAEDSEEEYLDDFNVELIVESEGTQYLTSEPTYKNFTATSRHLIDDSLVSIRPDKYGNNGLFCYPDGGTGVEVTVTANGLYIYPKINGITGADVEMPNENDYTEYSGGFVPTQQFTSDEAKDEYLTLYQQWANSQRANDAVINGWRIWMDENGQTMKIARETRKLYSAGWNLKTSVRFYISKTKPTIQYSQTPAIDVFAGDHYGIGLYDQNSAGGNGNNNAYLSDNSVVGIRPDENRVTIYDTIREFVSRFNELIFLFANFFLGFALITTILITAINIFKLATSSSHPVYRRDAIINLLTSFVCVSLLGAIDLFANLIIHISMGG